VNAATIEPVTDPANPYKLSMDELEHSTGHAPGEPLVEIEPEVEHHYEPPIRVTPMSPVTEIQALGQMTNASPEMKSRARLGALLLLVPFVVGVVFSVLSYLR
jgi:hypothetical protein